MFCHIAIMSTWFVALHFRHTSINVINLYQRYIHIMGCMSQQSRHLTTILLITLGSVRLKDILKVFSKSTSPYLPSNTVVGCKLPVQNFLRHAFQKPLSSFLINLIWHRSSLRDLLASASASFNASLYLYLHCNLFAFTGPLRGQPNWARKLKFGTPVGICRYYDHL